MCQVHGPSMQVICSACGEPYYECSSHTCKVFVTFEMWDADLQRRAGDVYTGNNRFFATLQAATQAVAAWPTWKRKTAWANEYKYCVGRPGN
jgi:hypothetical protein